MRWNSTCYTGDLGSYNYPQDKEFADLLTFLRQVQLNKKIYLCDVMNWSLLYPKPNYDVYIICAFGEAINDQFIQRLDTDEVFADRTVILLTSQYHRPLQQIKIFHIEHLHTITRFFPRLECSTLKQRRYNHGALSRRTTFHKTYALVRLRQHFADLQYSFCGFQDKNEYDVNQLVYSLLGGQKALTAEELNAFKHLHDNPIELNGDQWSIENPIYQDSRLIWTLESMFSSSGAEAFLTEKIIKSIVSRSAFILFSQRGSYHRLQQMGFETFDSQLPIDFDDQEDSVRFERLCDLMTQVDFDQWLMDSRTQEIVDYNYNYFYTDFATQVTQTNQEKIQIFLNYVNSI